MHHFCAAVPVAILLAVMLSGHTQAIPLRNTIPCPQRPCSIPMGCQRVVPSPNRCGCPRCALDCSAVLCAEPTCDNPRAPNPGQCCPRCPGHPGIPCRIKGQTYQTCGTDCPPTCDDPNPAFCTDQCMEGCQCPPGTLLDESREKCVDSQDECGTAGPNSCPIKGQVFMPCGTACPPTCANPDPGYCTKQCVPGCQCRTGKLLDEAAGRCVGNEAACSEGSGFGSG